LLHGVSYLAVIGGLLAMRLPPYVADPRRGSAWAGLSEAVAFIRSDRRIWTVVVLMAVFSIFGFPYLVMMPVFARDVLHRGATGYGVMMTAVGIGALIGALAVASLDRRIRKGPTLIAAGAAFALLLVAFALSQRYLLSVGLLALTGGTMIVNNALANATIQEIVPDQLRGRSGGTSAPKQVAIPTLRCLPCALACQRASPPTPDFASPMQSFASATANAAAAASRGSCRHRASGRGGAARR